MPTTVSILLFAQAREAVGRTRLVLPIAPVGASLREILDLLVDEHPRLRSVLPRCRFAVDGAYVGSVATRVAPGTEVAIHPPYSGG